MGWLSVFTGSESSKAAIRGAGVQAQTAREGREQLERLQAPFVKLGTDSLEGLQPFIDDPSGASFLQGNPMFQAAIDNTSRATKNFGAASGKANSGQVINELFSNYLAMGDQFVNSGFKRAFEPVRLGQNAAAFQGAGAADLATQAGNAMAAGGVGAANAKNEGVGNAISAIGAIASFFSDARLKENVERIGEDEHGIPIYEFNYIGEDGRYRGKMAQDIERVFPDDVVEGDNGYLMVTARHAPELIDAS